MESRASRSLCLLRRLADVPDRHHRRGWPSADRGAHLRGQLLAAWPALGRCPRLLGSSAAWATWPLVTRLLEIQRTVIWPPSLRGPRFKSRDCGPFLEVTSLTPRPLACNIAQAWHDSRCRLARVLLPPGVLCAMPCARRDYPLATRGGGVEAAARDHGGHKRMGGRQSRRRFCFCFCNCGGVDNLSGGAWRK